MRTSHKVFGGLCLGLFLLIQLGNTLEDPPVYSEPWLPRKVESNVSRKYVPKAHYSTRPWKDQAKQESQEWLEFIEDLDNRGLDIWDPEAEDLWSEIYN